MTSVINASIPGDPVERLQDPDHGYCIFSSFLVGRLARNCMVNSLMPLISSVRYKKRLAFGQFRIFLNIIFRSLIIDPRSNITGCTCGNNGLLGMNTLILWSLETTYGLSIQRNFDVFD